MAILTISREFGSGGREIGKNISVSLGYEFIDKERILQDIIGAGPEWEKWAREFDEHCPTVWEKYDWSFRGFVALLESIILDHALKDNVVIMGRGANFLLRDILYSLSVRLTAPLEQRIERVMERDSLDRKTASWLVQKTDADRACFIHTVFGKKWDDEDEFDMALNTGGRSFQEIENVIKAALLARDELKSEKAVHHLKMKALAAKIKAGIATDPSFLIPVLDIFPEDDTLVIRGVVHEVKEERHLEQKLQTLAGNTPIKNELHFRK